MSPVLEGWFWYFLVGGGYPVMVIMTILCISGPLMIKETKARFTKGVNQEDENTVYMETGVIALLLGVIWPLTVGVFIVVGALRGIGYMMKSAVKISSKE